MNADRLRAAAEHASEVLGRHADVRDGADGKPHANAAMSAKMELDAALAATPPDPALARSVELLTRARILAHALVGVEHYRNTRALHDRGLIRADLRDLLRGLDEAAVRSVVTACAPILGTRDADALVRMLWAETKQTQEDAFRGL